MKSKDCSSNEGTQQTSNSNITKGNESVSKYQYYLFTIYTDKLKDNWLQTLKDFGYACSCAISPCHDVDTKPHYHIIIAYKTKQDESYAQNLCKMLLKSDAYFNNEIVENVRNIFCMYRYLTHSDTPYKVQYNEKDIVSMNGFSMHNFALNETIEYINSNKEIINNYKQLVDFLIGIYKLDLLEFVVKHPSLFDKYLTSPKNNTASNQSVIEYIRYKNIYDYQQLVDNLISDNKNELLNIVSNNPTFFELYLNSKNQKLIDSRITNSTPQKAETKRFKFWFS
ncbi:MAG: hypothetical protein IJ078_05790 [Succinivibrionaceae bacterium]|nr:hypothetical protein [Succinivibrionaceae bacterium]